MTSEDEIRLIIEYLNKISKKTRRVGGREWTIAELAKIRSQPNEFSGGYDSKMILADACLAWRNKYNKTVKPRLSQIEVQYAHIDTLEKLRELIDHLGDNFNKEFWDFDSPRRKEMLEALVDAFIEYKRRVNILDDLQAMKDWARKGNPEDWAKGINGVHIKNLGRANYEYLRMLCGVDSIKLDKHILHGIREALGYSKIGAEANELVEMMAKRAGIPILEIDQILWCNFADEIPEIGLIANT